MSTILTKESLGYKDAETNDDARVRANINRYGSRISSGGELRNLLASNDPIRELGRLGKA
jgi:hypothetical protein